ncbi:hypothetical protein HDU96_003506, partial [Phlyctochytrium bullatum]
TNASIGEGPQTPPAEPLALPIAATSMNPSGQAVSTHLPAKTATPSLDAAANPFLAMSMTLAPSGPDLVPHGDCPASSPLAPLPSGRVSPFQVKNSPGILDPARAGTPGPTQTPLTRAELEGFDPLAPTTPITPPAVPQALTFGFREHRLAMIKSEPKVKSLSVTPPTSHPLKSNPFHSMPLPPASTGHLHDGRKATSPSFTPPSPPSYADASPSTAAVWRDLFGDSPEPELSPPHDAETEHEPSPPLTTAMSNHDADGNVKDESDDDDAVKIESDDETGPDHASSPSPTPPPPHYTTARRTGRPLAYPPVPRGSVNQPTNPSATPGPVPRPRAGEDSPLFFTPPTHLPTPFTPAGVAMPPARPHAEPAHRTAKTTGTNELGPARTVAFKPAPPPPMMTRARAAAIQQAAATPHPLTPTDTMATRPRTHPDRRAPFRTRDEMIAEIVGPQLFRGRGRPLFDANRPAFDTWESAMRRLATYASDGLTPAESLQRVRRFRWHPRRRTPIDAMTQLQLLSAACGTTIPFSELKHLFVTGCLDPRTARRLQNVRYPVNGLDLPWNDDRVTLELLAERALLETAASGHSATHDDDSSSSSSSSSSNDTTTSASSSSSDEDHHRRRRRNRKEKRRASTRRRRQSSSRRRRDHRSPSTDHRRRPSRDRRALESGRPSTSRGSTSTAAVDTAYPTQLVEAMETILAMHSPAG